MSKPDCILIVDDDETVRLSLADYLADMGFKVWALGSAECSLKVFDKFDADAAIIDLRLPGMSGEELIQQMHRLRPNIVFFIHTGAAHYPLPENLRQIGLTEENILYKPADLTTLPSLLRRLIDLRKK